MSKLRAKRSRTWIAALGALLILTGSFGCVVGQKIDLTYTPDTTFTPGQAQPLTVAVADLRPHVKNREKSPAYLGRLRGGFGNPWDVTTEGDVPLDQLFRVGLMADLEAMGFKAHEPQGPKTVKVEILDYDVDGMINGAFRYEIKVRVLDGTGAQLFENTLKEDRAISGSFWTGAKGALQKNVPLIHAEVIRKITREKSFLEAIQ
ncbi:hypothetical protein [Holophaga foetida]|uniref:hypothetical protein n=1 Tax=Holophaga foetida TaxID=35839 RepID=UPI00024717C6|nr:hypothetical protein [Holophaga foetida]